MILLLAVILLLSLWFPPEIHPVSRLILAVLSAVAALALLPRRYIAPAGAAERQMMRRATCGAIAVAGALLASATASLNPHASRHALVGLAGASAFYLGCRRWARPGSKRWLALFVGVASGVALWACRQAWGGMEETLGAALTADPNLTEGMRARLLSGRPFGTLALPAALGGLMAMAAPVAVGLASQARGARRAAAAAATTLLLVALGLSRSYGALVAITVAVVWAAGRWPRRAILFRLAAAAALVGAVALASQARQESTGQRLLETRGPIVQRWLNWGTGLRIAARYPALGCGPGAYASCFVLARQEGENDTRFAHNTPLQAASEAGLWVLLPLGFGLWRLYPRLRRARAASPAEAGAAVGLVAFLAHNLVDFTASLPSTLFAGLALAAVLPEEGTAPGSGETGAGRVSPELSRALAPAALALACVAGLAPTCQHWRASTLAETARELARRATGEQGEEALLVYRRAAETDPDWAELHLELAGLLLHQGGEGEATLEEALRHARDAARADAGLASARLLEAAAWQRRGEWAEAYLDTAAAAAIHPRNPRARAALEQVERSLADAGFSSR